MSGLIKALPWVCPTQCDSTIPEVETLRVVQKLTRLASTAETHSQFVCWKVHSTLDEAKQFWFSEAANTANAVEEVDGLWNRFIHSVYRTTGESLARLLSQGNFDVLGEGSSIVSSEKSGDDERDVDSFSQAILLTSYVIGIAFGRWDIQYATNDKANPELPDPFAPLPVCPPGQLQNSLGLPARPDDVPAAYPVKNIPWDGILVDDSNHSRDIEIRIRDVIEIIWSKSDRSSIAEEIEHETCEILGVKSLRDYFRKPAGFFADHLSRYSKSRRQAPIYWPLSTDSGNYTLWLYYHRLTDQTLYTAVNDFVEPKQKQVNDDLKVLRSKTDRSKAEEVELERLSVLSTELDDFRKELLRIADFWKPNLNDGVQITAAPLWKFFRLKKWRDTLKKTWEELEAGDYDWAHLALSIWPARVVRTAHKDRSIAIAHDLEELLWHEVEIAKKSKTGKVTLKTEWQPRELSEKELDAIVERVKSGKKLSG